MKRPLPTVLPRMAFLLGGLSSKGLIRLTPEDHKVTSEERIDLGERIRDLIQALDGAVSLIDEQKGELQRLTPTP